MAMASRARCPLTHTSRLHRAPPPSLSPQSVGVGLGTRSRKKEGGMKCWRRPERSIGRQKHRKFRLIKPRGCLAGDGRRCAKRCWLEGVGRSEVQGVARRTQQGPRRYMAGMNRKRYRSAARSWYGCHEIPAEWVGITSLSEALMLSSTCRKKVILASAAHRRKGVGFAATRPAVSGTKQAARYHLRSKGHRVGDLEGRMLKAACPFGSRVRSKSRLWTPLLWLPLYCARPGAREREKQTESVRLTAPACCAIRHSAERSAYTPWLPSPPPKTSFQPHSTDGPCMGLDTSPCIRFCLAWHPS
mmetsp:Transcript_28463/g.67464  ORF Transcript_28463/g.67464 Transcript_28463/m.67464 type:complete len:302 (-) Transcript_28463:497-1402(-)